MGRFTLGHAFKEDPSERGYTSLALFFSGLLQGRGPSKRVRFIAPCLGFGTVEAEVKWCRIAASRILGVRPCLNGAFNLTRGQVHKLSRSGETQP